MLLRRTCRSAQLRISCAPRGAGTAAAGAAAAAAAGEVLGPTKAAPHGPTAGHRPISNKRYHTKCQLKTCAKHVSLVFTQTVGSWCALLIQRYADEPRHGRPGQQWSTAPCCSNVTRALLTSLPSTPSPPPPHAPSLPHMSHHDIAHGRPPPPLTHTRTAFVLCMTHTHNPHLSLNNVTHALPTVLHEVAQCDSSSLQQPRLITLLKQATQQQAEASSTCSIILYSLRYRITDGSTSSLLACSCPLRACTGSTVLEPQVYFPNTHIIVL
jgi:hypothetical protein